jgi:hypothetical protein
MNAETNAVSVLRESARHLQRIASNTEDAKLAEHIRCIALECDHGAATLERYIAETRPKPANGNGAAAYP